MEGEGALEEGAEEGEEDTACKFSPNSLLTNLSGVYAGIIQRRKAFDLFDKVNAEEEEEIPTEADSEAPHRYRSAQEETCLFLSEGMKWALW